MALYSEKTKEAPQEAPREEPKQEEKPAAEANQLVYPPGPSQEQLDATSNEAPQELPDNIKAALRGEESVVSLPLEVQGGDSLNPPTPPEPADEEADTES